MKKEDFSRYLASVVPEPSAGFSDHMDRVLGQIVRQEENARRTEPRNGGTGFNKRVFALALAVLVLLCSAAWAAAHWGIFDSLGFLFGRPESGMQLQKIMHRETVNDVEISILEAGYDGRTLLLQYSYRLPGETQAWASSEDGLPPEAMEQLNSRRVGWWIDHFWIDGQCVDMAANSGSVTEGTENPGEILITEYWRLDHLEIALDGRVTIALPIGEKQPLEQYSLAEHPEKYDADGMLRQPQQGVVVFSFDAGDVRRQITTLHPGTETVVDEGRVTVAEAAFSPLMTYITLALEGDPRALEAYKAANGEGLCDEQGNLLWPYTAADVHYAYITSLTLVDGEGNELFPEHHGCNGVGDEDAEFLYPAIPAERMPEELWLAPKKDGIISMQEAVQIR